MVYLHQLLYAWSIDIDNGKSQLAYVKGSKNRCGGLQGEETVPLWISRGMLDHLGHVFVGPNLRQASNETKTRPARLGPGLEEEFSFSLKDFKMDHQGEIIIPSKLLPNPRPRGAC